MHLSQAKLERLDLPEAQKALAGVLTHLEYTRDALCAAVLDALRPTLDTLSPPPEEGWLVCAYHALTDGLFPDPNAVPPPPAVQRGLDLLIPLLDAALACEEAPFDPLTDLLPFDADCTASRVADEYPRFLSAVRDSRFLLTLRLSREVMPFDAASHTIGVRNLAVHTALLARQAGLPADVPLTAAAALCHDIGKFACRGKDARRVPYLHYYYTWQWLCDRNMEHIAHISANHSTWDLEFENLPIESLLLIYADYRVRGTREDGREIVRIYSLEDSYGMIMSKLSDVTPEKERRYRLVYRKLRDFERFLHGRGIGTEFSDVSSAPRTQSDIALLSAEEALDALRDLTFENNIRLMHMISTDASFDLLLEQARGEKNTHRIRTYLRLFDEYSTYMTRSSKQKLLSFLYDLLSYPEGDVRRISGHIMGLILANSGPKYRKELPSAAPKTAIAPTMLALLDESVTLWDTYVEACLHPDHKIAQKHALRISNSLKAICESLFTACEPQLAEQLLQPLFSRLPELSGYDCFVLLDALCHVPPALVRPKLFQSAQPALRRMLQSGTPRWQLVALLCVDHLRGSADEEFLQSLRQPLPDEAPVVAYLRQRIAGETPEPLADTALIYLSNLKNAVHWLVKNIQIDMLCDDVARHPENAFHTAMHLSNLLSVSEHLPVREHAGAALLGIADRLSVDQRNEIVVDLIRELENGHEQIAHFIPTYLARLLCTLPEKEISEAVDTMEQSLRSGTVRPASPVLRTLGGLVASLPLGSREIIDRCLGLLLTGIAHYNSSIQQNALYVLCHNIIENEALPTALRAHCFTRVAKKLLSLISEPSSDKLTLFHRAAMLNHLYRFLTRYEVEQGVFRFPAPKPVAFFPGTFDPFTAGHKQIVQEILARGFEVYLAVDEFSWSKRTLARRLRRKIVQMSVADQWDTYIFPDELPVNIAVPQDLAALRSRFPGRELYLVAGSDVIYHASAYRSELPGGVQTMNHIIVRRPACEEAPPLESLLHGKLIFFSLPEQLESISSTQIRDDIDKNLDISALVDPIVQAYIYEYGLYLRSPMLKRVLAPQAYVFRTPESASAPPELFEFLRRTAQPSAVALYSRRQANPIGWAYGHTVTVATLYDELHDVEACSSVRRCTSGKLLMIDGVHADKEQTRPLLNELLVRSLSEDHTYALCRCAEEDGALAEALRQLGFVRVEGTQALHFVDMRAPMVLIQDVRLCIKAPHHDMPEVEAAVAASRPKLRRALSNLYPGKLLLCFDAELLNQSLMFKVQQHNNVLGLENSTHLGSLMCVPYGRILSDEIVPNTVTKTLHVDKRFAPDGSSFTVEEFPGFSTLQNQVRTLKSFRRSVILVDDLLHKGYRIAKLNRLFEQEDLEISRIIVGILSGRGRDLMREQHRQVDCEYFIPNLHYWVTESLLYPFIGGDTVSERPLVGRMLPSVNLILPYYYPRHFVGTSDAAVRAFSRTALENALEILRALEHTHQQTFSTALTLRRLGEALTNPRLPDRGRCLKYDFSVPASAYLRDDLLQLDRIRIRGDAIHGA